MKPEGETSARPDSDQTLSGDTDDPDNFTSQMDEESLPQIQFTPPPSLSDAGVSQNKKYSAIKKKEGEMDHTSKKMKNIYTYEAGNTLESYKQFVKKLTKRGAKEATSPEESDVSIVFCPIVSRFETDINAALSSAKEKGCTKVILVAMHHTFDKDYIVPNHRQQSDPAVILMVDCLFFEKKGFLSCSCNKKAVKTVCNEMGLLKKKLKKKKKNHGFFRRLLVD